MKRPVVIASLTVLSTVLFGCTQTHRPVRPEVTMPDRFSTGSTTAMKSDPRLHAWWRGFEDPVIDRLMRQGMRENLSIEQARQRLDIVRLKGILASSGYLPQLQATTSASRSSETANGNTQLATSSGAGAAFSWTLDIFGGGRAALREAHENSAAAMADVELVRLAFLTDLTATYVDLRYNEEAIGISRRNLASFQQTLKLTQDMRETGIASNLDVAQAQALVDDARAKIPPIERDRQQAINHLATLLGTTNSEIEKLVGGKSGQPKLALEAESGFPADLLRYRPDIRREERLLAAAAARIDIARSRLYPALSLSGSIDFARLIASGVSGNALSWAFGPSVLAPIFDGGRLRGEVDIQKAETKVQYLRWKDTVFRAVEEVENALVALNRGKAEASAHRRKVTSFTVARDLARESYVGGTGLILDVLEAERLLGEAKLDLARSLRENALAGIRLQVALGSGAAVEIDGVSASPAHPAPSPVQNRAG
ncbi:efflux transporter outer membrane subunit [Rhizobium sp. AAP43]|uniref:efflux transporter outer membrane subunit n=1 Tax=Rhizobium sp. AAP43 TaxID=1523420 RepID=UPI0009E7B918|nr:efflux transporter outer membrane subunit [Rhizobium sp. AAP43]